MIYAKLLAKDYRFETKAGLFSKDHIDEATLFLINHMEINPTDIVLDIGCGYGPIGIVAATRAYKGKVFMVDVDIRAVKYSRMNANINKVTNVEVIPSDGFEDLPKVHFNVVLSNPPSHTPKETVIKFIEDARTRLHNKGMLYFVTEKRIKPMIKREFERVFGNYEAIASTNEFVISRTIRNGE